MSDDTTTWLKKNPAVNPLRRSLKTSLRFHIPSSDMNASIMSNPDKVKDQGLFIPRMLQKSSLQMRKSRASEFKVPEMVAKPVAKKSSSGIEVNQKKIPTPNKARKSLLPVSKPKGQVPENILLKSSLPRPSFFPGGSARRTAKRELIKKAVELSEIKRREVAESQAKIIVEESSVLRSILKKRASLRRTSKISKKPKAKKVLFDGFENSDGDGEKENDVSLSESRNDFNTALDEPTVFLNIPNGTNLESPFEAVTLDSVENTTVVDNSRQSLGRPSTVPRTDISTIITLWQSYKENLSDIQTERSSLEDSLQSLLQHSVNFEKEYKAYKESSEEMFSKLLRLGKEIEESLRKVIEGGCLDTVGTVKRRRRSMESRSSEKIKMSEKSKAITKNSKRKSMPVMKKELLREMEDSFSIICRGNF